MTRRMKQVRARRTRARETGRRQRGKAARQRTMVVVASARPEAVEQPPALARVHRAALAAIAFGTVVGVAVVAAGIALAWQERRAQESSPAQPATDDLEIAGSATHPEGAEDDAGHAHGADDSARAHGAPSPRLAVTAKHVGGQRILVQARATSDGRPLRDLRLVVTFDMQQMPGAHGGGPFVLRPTRTAGAYEATLTVPMVGDYELRVVAQGPQRAEKRVVVPVGVLEVQPP